MKASWLLLLLCNIFVILFSKKSKERVKFFSKAGLQIVGKSRGRLKNHFLRQFQVADEILMICLCICMIFRNLYVCFGEKDKNQILADLGSMTTISGAILGYCHLPNQKSISNPTIQ